MTEIMKQEGIPEKDLYVNSGYLFNSRVPFREKKRPLRILSAGAYQLFSWPKLPTLRPRGRVDWQIIYIAAGKGHFILDGKEVIVPAGSMILYQPKQVQDYFYFGKDKTQVWFVHFTGREVRNIFSHYEIPTDGYILHTGISKEYEDLFRRMRYELVNCSWGYEEHYNEDFSIEQYAVSRNMSTSWFNRSFRSAMGTSPMKYIKDIRIRNAQTLLETTDYSISDIAALIGYDNPMYFSRLFRKAKGLSPSKYRKTFREQFMAGVAVKEGAP